MNNSISDERLCRYDLDVEFYFLNEYDILKPSAYPALFAQLSERQLTKFNMDNNRTMEFGLAWALISISIDIIRPIDRCMTLSARTWFSGRKGPYYRRELVFENNDGGVMFQGSTFSILMDVTNRKVFRKKETPFKVTPAQTEYCTEADPRYRPGDSYLPVDSRSVHPSDIDKLGHVNNRRYGDFAYDVLTESEIQRLAHLKRLDFHFMSELRKNQDFQLEKSIEANRIRVRGLQEGASLPSFETAFCFE